MAADASVSEVAPVLIGGQWRSSAATETFHATNPRTRERLGELFPVSPWIEISAALSAASSAAAELREIPDAAAKISNFLERYAAGIESSADELSAIATLETGLAVSPRLKDVELPRTTGQLCQAAAAARSGEWQRPIIDTKAGLRSCLAPIGPVLVIGPNNFPFAFNGIAGGDFAAAIAAGNPVIAKAHPLHPGTSRRLAEIATSAANAAGIPSGSVQMLFHVSSEDGQRMVADKRLAAVAFTGGRHSGLKLKAAADSAGKLFFGEMSSVNPTVILPGALDEVADSIADQLATSLQMGTGQFCTKPGLIFLMAGSRTETFICAVAAKLSAAQPGVLFSESGLTSILTALHTFRDAGAQCITGGAPTRGGGYSVENTLMRVTAQQFLNNPGAFQPEAFGNAALVVIADDADELLDALRTLEGNLTGAIYTSTAGADEAFYKHVASTLRPRVGRLINDKMPTGVAVSPAQNHGGPYPATSQPHFTAVGLPASIARFTQLESYDNVRPHRLPPCLRNENPTGRLWRQIDGHWTQSNS